VKLGRFRPRTGPTAGIRSAVVVDEPHPARSGRLDGGERLLDLASALAHVMIEHEGADPDRAAEYARAALPSSMVAILGAWVRSKALIGELRASFQAGEIPPDAESPLGPVVMERDAVVLLSPVDRPPCIRDFFAFETHMKNALGNLGLDVPDAWYEAPSHYVTRSGAVFGPDEDGAWPWYTEMLDFELEFGIVIGTSGIDIRPEQAWEHIGGFTIFNDLSCRDVQRREMATRVGPAKTKGFDRGTGLGPYLTTADEFSSPFTADMRAYVNDELWSEGSAGSIYWPVEQIVAHASSGETLVPGDVLGSGTVGTGAGIEIDRWLSPGDVVRLEIDGIGALETRVVRDAGSATADS
jgi:2-keto-4-pentenoate hydratase/2-oxohepta-3-ene-1,7-dioic acid hydratase in catechol pathway